VGQLVDQRVDVQCPLEWRQNTTEQWTVPGNRLRDYVMTLDGSAALQVVDDDGGQDHPIQVARTGLKQPEIKFFWVSTSAEGATEQQAVSVQISNVDGNSYNVSSTYRVCSPTVSATAILGTAGILP